MRHLTLAILVAALLTACTSQTTAPPTSTTETDGSTVDLPVQCVEAITNVLVAVEPVASEIDWDNATDADVEAVTDAGLEAGDAFDPEVCPDVGVDEARAAWLEIAADVAPGSSGYVEFIFADE
jgi:hypothetical protein